MGPVIIETPIRGVVLENLQLISTSGGSVLKMLTPESPLLPDMKSGFGELYFSEINFGVIRAWKRHKAQCQRFTVPAGLLKLGFVDARKKSPSQGKAFSLLLGRPGHYRLLAIPAGVWYGFEGLASQPSLICNLASTPHNPEDILRAPPSGPESPADWNSLAPWEPPA